MLYVMLNITLIQKHYLLAKVASTLLAFGFALIYSRQLGIENRSIVGYIFVLTSFIWIVLTSGTTLTLRKMDPDNQHKFLASFFSLILIEALLGIVLFGLGIFLFSILKTPIPSPITLLGMAYFISSGLTIVLIELLIARIKYFWSGYLELLAVIFQYILYFTIIKIDVFSIAISLLTSFVFSYLFIAAIGFVLLKPKIKIYFSLGAPSDFLKMTKGSHALGISLAAMDRLDKIFIAFYFPVGLLAQFSIMSSLISVFRFIPDSFSKFLISGSLDHQRRIVRAPLFWGILLIPFSISAIFISQLLIARLLGPEWLLPWAVTFVFIIQELARGVFQLVSNHKISVGLVQNSHIASILLVIVSIFFVFLFSWKLGIVGVPLSFVCSYIFILFYLLRKKNLV